MSSVGTGKDHGQHGCAGGVQGLSLNRSGRLCFPSPFLQPENLPPGSIKLEQAFGGCYAKSIRSVKE